MYTAKSTNDSLRSGRIGVSLWGRRLQHSPTWILQDASGQHCMRLRRGPACRLCISIYIYIILRCAKPLLLLYAMMVWTNAVTAQTWGELAIYGNGCKWWGTHLWHRPSHPRHPISSSNVIQEMIRPPHGRRLHCSRTCMDPNRISAGIFHLGGKVARKSVQVFPHAACMFFCLPRSYLRLVS